MRRFLTHIALFLLFAVPVYVVLLFAFGMLPQQYLRNVFTHPDKRSFLRERISELPRYRSVDLLVLGSSVAYRGLDPRVFATRGHSVFVLASDGQTPVQAELLLRRYLDTLQPKCVLLAVYPDIIVTDRPEPAIDLAMSDRIDAASWRDALRQPNARLLNSLLYWNLRQAAGIPARPLHWLREKDQYVAGGFLLARHPNGNADLAKACSPGPGPQLAAANMQALDACLALLREHNIPVVLAQLPMPVRRYACRTHAAALDSVFAGRGHYYNFNGRVPLHDSLDFLDNIHLAPSGAQQCSRAVCAQLEADGFLDR